MTEELSHPTRKKLRPTEQKGRSCKFRWLVGVENFYTLSLTRLSTTEVSQRNATPIESDSTFKHASELRQDSKKKTDHGGKRGKRLVLRTKVCNSFTYFAQMTGNLSNHRSKKQRTRTRNHNTSTIT